MANVALQIGKLGLESPKQAAELVIVIESGIRSRTGRAMGHVDEGLCVDVTAYGPPGDFGRPMLGRERLYAPDRYDPSARNSLGTLGAYCDQRPSKAAIDEAVARISADLSAGRDPGIKISVCAAAEGP